MTSSIDSTGTVDHVAGIAQFTTTDIPDALITYAYDYSTGVHTESFNPTKSGSSISVALANTPIRPGSVRCQWVVNHTYLVNAISMGQSAFVINVYDDGDEAFESGSISGSIDYASGAITMIVDATRQVLVPQMEWKKSHITGVVSGWPVSWSWEDVGYTFTNGALFSVRYQDSAGTTESVSEGYPLPPVKIYLGVGAAGPTVPGSLRFTFRARTYVDRNGSLYFDVSETTNTGTLGGSYDYASNVATITAFGTGSDTTVTIHSMLTRYVNPGVSGVLFRAPGRPLRAESFTIRATSLDGTLMTATTDINGVIAGTGIAGDVDWQTGIARVAFGAMVTAAGNESEPWYDPDAVVGGNIWKPMLVDPSSVFFGCVVYRSIPLDPSIVGIDPVRLPNDGRVVAMRPGDVAVVHHTAETVMASPTGGSTIDLGRERLAWAEVFDAANTPVESVWYTLDLDDGELVWADPLNLSAYTLPITCRHRIEDARLCTDVQISGEITLQAALSHDFPAGTQISSAIAYGDKQARQTNLFDQATWTSEWSDTLIGSAATGSFNNTVYPIEVTNDGAIDERWAIVFTSGSAVNVIGETVGQVLTNVPISADIAPINPVGGEPYFTMDKDGFGGGWAAQNVIRFNTLSATGPVWLARVIKPSTPTVDADRTRWQIYGNAH